MSDILILRPLSLDVASPANSNAVLIKIDLGPDQKFLLWPVAFQITSDEARLFAESLLCAAATAEGDPQLA